MQENTAERVREENPAKGGWHSRNRILSMVLSVGTISS